MVVGKDFASSFLLAPATNPPIITLTAELIKNARLNQRALPRLHTLPACGTNRSLMRSFQLNHHLQDTDYDIISTPQKIQCFGLIQLQKKWKIRSNPSSTPKPRE